MFTAKQENIAFLRICIKLHALAKPDLHIILLEIKIKMCKKLHYILIFIW